MKYTKYTIKTTVEAEDIIAAELASLGIDGVEIYDSRLPEEDGVPVFIDDMPENRLKDGEAELSFYLDANEDNTLTIKEVQDMLSSLEATLNTGDLSLACKDTKDEDWINNWKEFFHQFTIEFEDGEKSLFIPSWEKQETDASEYSMTINIDPGTAFGTGAHETTSLCIKALHKYVKKGMFLVDIGTGSGILPIVAIKSGASGAIGTDIDPNAEAAIIKNIEDNDILPDSFEYVMGNVLDDIALQQRLMHRADIMTANILPDVLVPLFPLAKSILKDKGIFIISGIIDEKAAYIKQELLNNDFVIIEEASQGEWVSFVAQLSE